MKSVDPEEPVRLAALGEPYSADLAGSVSIDITRLSPEDAAAMILADLRKRRP